jgi:hypothetical protein
MQILLHAKYQALISTTFAFFHSIFAKSVIFSHFFEIKFLNLPPDIG